MILSTEIDNARHRLGGSQEKAVELIGKAGFDAWDFTMIAMAWYNPKLGRIMDDHPLTGSGRLAYARKLRRIGEDYGMFCNQSHAPFPAWYKGVTDSYKHALECTAEAGGKICVMHPDNYKSAEENAEIFYDLISFAHECGVKIAIENMCNYDEKLGRFLPQAACSTPEDFLKHLAMIDDPYFVACVDVGHAELRDLGSSAVDMIRALGPKVQALHLHDNDKIGDLHRIPFSESLDYTAIIKALKEINYSGDFTLECGIPNDRRDEEGVLEGLKEMRSAVKRLADMFEQNEGE